MTSAGARRSAPAPLLVLSLLLLFGAGLRFYGLGRESLWNDELHSRWVSSAPTVGQVVTQTRDDDGHPPLHNLLLHGIQRYWGDSEADLRFPSALAGVLSIVAIFVLGRLLYGTSEGLVAAGLLTVLWCTIFYSQEARPYSLLLFAVLVASGFWIALLQRWVPASGSVILSEAKDLGEGQPPPRSFAPLRMTTGELRLAAGYVVIALAACYLHHFGAGLVFLQGAGSLFLTRNRRAVLFTWAAVLAGYVPGIVYLLRQRRHSGSWAWIERPNLYSATEYLKFLFNYSRTLAALALLVGFLAWLRARGSEVPPEYRIGPLTPSALLGLWLLLPVLGAVAVSYLSFPLLTNRNLIVGLPAAYLLLARAIVILTRGRFQAALATAVLVGLLAHLLFVMRYYSVPHKEQFREAVAEVAARDPDPTGSLVIGRAYHREYFDYYFARLGSRRRIDLVAGADADIPAARALLAARRPERVWLLSGHLSVEEGFSAFLRDRYEEREHRSLVGTEVWLFTRRGAGGGLWNRRPSDKMGETKMPMPPPPTPFKLLVFDWDGTLMDSVATIVACAKAMLGELGLPQPPDAVIRGTVGLGLRETIDQLVPGCDAELYRRVVDTYRAHWISTYQHLPLLFPGVPEMLRRLADEGYLLGIATGKGRRGLEHALRTTGLSGLFHATRTVDEAPSKPNPGMLLDILYELGARPDEAVMIGDTTYDLAMAHAAGMGGLAVLSGSQAREELERLLPLACLESVAEVPDWLAGVAGLAVATSSPSSR